MDSRDLHRSELLEAIKEKYKSGGLTYGEMCRRLATAVETELNKPPERMDVDYLESCQDLLNSLTNSKHPEPYESKQPQYEQEMIKQLNNVHRRQTAQKRRTFTIAALAVAMLVFLVIGDRLLYREWFEGSSSTDQQQYNVSGNVVDPNLLTQGHATNSDETREITTSDIDEAASVLGFMPLIPTSMPEGWGVREYYALANEDYARFTVDFTSDTNRGIVKYEVRQYQAIESAWVSFEQSEHGDMILCNGWEVYFTTNIERMGAIWLDGDTTYSLYGPVSKEDLIQMINSIERGETK